MNNSGVIYPSPMEVEFKELADVWDTCKAKALVMVIEARGLPLLNILPFVKTTIGEISYRTKPLKNTNMVWNELFLYYDVPLESNLIIELYIPSQHKKKEEIIIGSILIDNLSSIPHDRPLDKWYPIQLRIPSKEPDIPQLHLRLLFSAVMETRASNLRVENVFWYEEHLNSFKTGDLIAFSGVGLLPSLSMIFANAPISGVGLLLKVPNKWTRKLELYIAEVTRNVDRIVDSFRETSTIGLNIFRFEERLYQFNGTSIFWCSLKKPLEEESEQKMLQWIWSVHGSGGINLIPQIDNILIKQWVIDHLGEKITKSGMQFVDLLSHTFVTECLKFANVSTPQKIPNCAMDVVRYECFNRPVPLRLSGSAGQAYLLKSKSKSSPSSSSSSISSSTLSSPELTRPSTPTHPGDMLIVNNNNNNNNSSHNNNSNSSSSNSPSSPPSSNNNNNNAVIVSSNNNNMSKDAIPDPVIDDKQIVLNNNNNNNDAHHLQPHLQKADRANQDTIVLLGSSSSPTPSSSPIISSGGGGGGISNNNNNLHPPHNGGGGSNHHHAHHHHHSGNNNNGNMLNSHSNPAFFGRSATIATITPTGRKGTRSLIIPDFSTAKLERFEKLGSGGFGSVYRCAIDGYTCAMKVLKIDQNTKKMDIAAVKTEVSILERARHQNIVRYLGYDFNPTELILFMEYLPASLQKVLTNKIENPYCIHQNDSSEVRFFALEIAKGIAYLHHSDPPIIHRDIKSGNVLVATDGEGKITTVKLCDFGVAKICQSRISAANTFVGTPGLMAPEIRVGKQLYSEKVDIWSFGILLYEMIAFSSPILPDIWIPPELDPSFEPLIGLVKACLVENPSQRPTAKQLVECLALMYTTS